MIKSIKTINKMKRIYLLIAYTLIAVVCHAQTAQELFGRADSMEKAGNNAEALAAYLQADGAFVTEGKGYSPERARCLHNIGRTYNNLGDIANGREYTRRAMDMRRKLSGEVSEDYITSLNNYALTFALEQDYAAAVTHQQKVMELCGRLSRPHANLGLYAANMGRFCYFSKDMDNAVKYCEMALANTEQYGYTYEKMLELLGNIYIEKDDIANQERILALAEDHNRHELTKPCDEPDCMLERARYYSYTGDNAQAKDCYLKLLAMPMDSNMKAHVHESYASFMFRTNDYASAIEYQLTAAKFRKEAEGDTDAYVLMMHKAGTYCFIGKQYQQALDCYQVVLDKYAPQSSADAMKNVAMTQKGIGNVYVALKDYGKAKEAFRQSLDYYEANARDDKEYPKTLLRLAKAEKFAKDYQVSIGHHRQAMALFDEMGLTEDYADAAASLQLCYRYAGIDEDVDGRAEAVTTERNAKLDRIIKEETERLEMSKRYLGGLAYARSLATIAGSYGMKEDYDNARRYYQWYIIAVRDAIRDEFRMQGEAGRMTIWREEAKTIRQLQELLVTLPEGNDTLRGELTALVYDAALLSKGILLNSSIEFGKVLQARGDTALMSIYARTRANEEEIGRLRKTFSTDDDLERIVALTQENRALQQRLYKECAEFADFTNYISYDWEWVRDVVCETGDVAIEFVAIKTSPIDRENFMMALVLTDGTMLPVAIPVCTLAEAKDMETADGLFDMKENMVWGALSKYLEGKRRIFFSADGSFNRIGIEYLAYNGKPLSEQFEVYRLSSTKELCYEHKPAARDKAVVFGDIDYTDLPVTPAGAGGTADAVRGVGDAGGLANLENTLREVDGICEILRQGNVKDIVRLTDREAGKAAFLALDSSGLNLLHIATHGIYEDTKKSTDAESMANSKLAFAGANLDGRGIVTAAEVAAMNLRQCDLVVLSACETGLGKLGDDGVFGLQRGFKNAGARTLLMSLKNVYDNTTADMMLSFYRNMTAGQTKREALVNAQKELRDKGFDNPKYWATFILLDAL